MFVVQSYLNLIACVVNRSEYVQENVFATIKKMR